MEALLAQMAPGVDFSDKLGKPVKRPDEKDDPAEHTEGKDASKQNSVPRTSPGQSPHDLEATTACGNTIRDFMKLNHAKTRSGHDDSPPDLSDGESEDDDIAFIETGLSKTNLTLSPDEAVATRIVPERPVFSSGEASLLDTRNLPWGKDIDSSLLRVHRFVGKASDIHLIPLLEKIASMQRRSLSVFPRAQRTEFWNFPSGLIEPPPSLDKVHQSWPEPDLADKLINSYFSRANRDSPILNEAEFRHEYYEQPELRDDHEWVAVALGVFMVASHYVNDPRTWMDPKDRHSQGVQWWNCARSISWTLCPNLKPIRKIQSLLLSILFQLGTPLSVSTSWGLLGVAVRTLQDYGAHRKLTARKLAMSRVDEENFKRTFWVAYSWDRELSTALGRPLMMQDEDIDIDLPLEVDDEIIYKAPENGPVPQQPEGKPALISGFISTLRLDEIIGRTLKTVYALHKVKARYGVNGRAWDERLVAEIDLALNNWLDTVPEHLRYDPHQENDEYLVQSSLLYTKYYQCQILVHRPFISSSKSSASLNFPSLAICTNAARSISHVVDNLKKRGLATQSGLSIGFRASKAGTILLLVVWGAKRNGGRVSSSALSDLKRAISVLKSMENQWQVCGKVRDVLESLVASSELVIPEDGNEQGSKRTRDDVSREDSFSSSVSPPENSNGADEGEAGARKVAGKKADHTKGLTSQLPISTKQLASSGPNLSSGETGTTQSSPSSQQSGAAAMVQSTDPSDELLADAIGNPFSLFTPLAMGVGSSPAASGAGLDYMMGSNQELNQAILTPSIFDNMSFTPADLNQAGQAQGAAEMQADSMAAAESNNPLANYAFELLQKPNIWGLDDDYLNFLQQQAQQQRQPAGPV